MFLTIAQAGAGQVMGQAPVEPLIAGLAGEQGLFAEDDVEALAPPHTHLPR